MKPKHTGLHPISEPWICSSVSFRVCKCCQSELTGEVPHLDRGLVSAEPTGIFSSAFWEIYVKGALINHLFI